MSLTVPQAGVIAGRAAEVRVTAPDTGGVLSALGQRMADQATKYKAEQLDYHGKKLQIDIAGRMAAARRDAEQLGDPMEMGKTWDARKAEIADSYLNGTDDAGNPIVPPELRQGIELTIGELDNRHTDALAGQQTRLIQSQRDASWMTLSEDIALKASKSDAVTAGAMIEVADNAIDQRVAAGAMTPKEGAAQKLGLRETIYGARATTQMDADPEAFLTAAANGEYDSLGPEKLASKMTTAQAEIYRRAAAEEKAVEVAVKARETEIGKRLGEMTDLMAGGFKVVDEDFLKDPEVAAHPDFAKAQAAQSLRDEIPSLRQMTPTQIGQLIEAERAAPKAHKYQTERLKQLETWQEQAVQRWNTDAKSVAAEAGMKPPALEFDPENPAGFAGRLPTALGYDAKLRADGYTTGQAVFSSAEAAKLRGVIEPKAETAPKLALAQSIAVGAGSGAPRVLAALQADPVFARTTRLLQSTRDTDLAEAILRGQQKAELKTVIMPAPRMMQQAFDAVTGGAFDSRPALKAEMLAAASALYADGAWGIDPESQSGTGWLDDSTAIDLFSKSVQRVSGARPDRNGEFTVGGVQNINDGFVSLPVGVEKRVVEDTLENLDAHLRGQRRTAQGWDSSASDVAPDTLRAFKAASVDGRVPDLGANPSARMAELQLQRVLTKSGEETDQFKFVRMVDGRAYAVGDDKGVEYRFRLPALIREAAK